MKKSFFLILFLFITNISYAIMPPYPDSANSFYYQHIGLKRDFPKASGGQEVKTNNHPNGNFNLLVVGVDFSDKLNNTQTSFFDSLFFSQQFESIKNYYSYESYKKLNLKTNFNFIWVRAPQPYSYYVGSNFGLGNYPNNSQKLCEDVIETIDSFVNFKSYDNNDDGYVDGVVIVHSGSGAEFTGLRSTMWSHEWGISPKLKDSVYISSYLVGPEFWSISGDMTIGVYCHELGHIFGLPDLYDLDYTSKGIGKWSVMAFGAWNGIMGNSPSSFDSWSRISLGFSDVNEILSEKTLSIQSSNSNSTVYKILTNTFSGYYLLENRQRNSYDTTGPWHGLLIWRIDETRWNNNSEWYPNDFLSTGHFEVALIQADNQWDLERNNNSGDPFDPFPGSDPYGIGNQFFNHLSKPSSDWYDSTNLNISIDSIQENSGIITCNIKVEQPTIVKNNDDKWDYFFNGHQYDFHVFYTGTFIDVYFDNPRHAKLEIFNILGQTVFSSNTSSGETLTWDNSKFPQGIYLARITGINLGHSRTVKIRVIH